MKSVHVSILMLALLTTSAWAMPVRIETTAAGPNDIPLDNASIVYDTHDAAVVGVAANLLADDINRATSHRPQVTTKPQAVGGSAIIMGTLGQSPLIDELVKAGKVDADSLKGKWESHIWQTVANPVPGIASALVIVGSDRRGTAYGATDLSRAIGVSPWYWWADVPVQKHAHLTATHGLTVAPSPGVKYRGIFINDEDWGMRPWAKKHDPSHNIGPETYGHIFELMLRLHLNYIWPAMHPGSAEFTTFPRNAACANKWAIVTGSSHCEPMLRNNVYWPKSNGPWRYDTNRQNIFNYWKWSAVNRGKYESVWTLGIRGIHDSPMRGPKSLSARVNLLEEIIHDQQQLIHQYVSHKFGPPAECFVPYKEVLPIYNDGMKVPDNVTLVWPDDNYGYMRRLSTEADRARSGGSGVYYHFSYLGGPRSYTWVESTSPGFIWEELHKAYVNNAKTLWVVNVGDLKPAELAIDFYSRLAWSPNAIGPEGQTVFLKDITSEMFGSAGPKVTALLDEYYRLAAERKPEFIAGYDPQELSPAERAVMVRKYQKLHDDETAAAAAIEPANADAYFETVGYAARVFAATGLLFCGPSADQQKWMNYINQQTQHYNHLKNGKWEGMISDTTNGVRWPKAVGGKLKPSRGSSHPTQAVPGGVLVDAAKGQSAPGKSRQWTPVAGLGWSGRAVTLLAAAHPGDGGSASLTYPFNVSSTAPASLHIFVLPTMHLIPGGKQQFSVSVDGQPSQTFDVPGAESGSENSPQRRHAVLSSRQTITVPMDHLTRGHHTLKIHAIDSGMVIDQIEFPPGTVVQ